MLGTNYLPPNEEFRRITRDKTLDIPMETTDGYLDFFELKRADEDVLRFDQNRKVYFFAPHIAVAIAQCADYIKTIEDHRLQLAQDGFIFLKPRARIVGGRSTEWPPEKKNALQVLNHALHYIELWTYDQLVQMAERMVALYETPLSSE